jgi:hypothetical protein
MVVEGELVKLQVDSWASAIVTLAFSIVYLLPMVKSYWTFQRLPQHDPKSILPKTMPEMRWNLHKAIG